MTWLTPFEGKIYAALRIVAGLMMSCHGMQKLFGWFDPPLQMPLFSQVGLGGVLEFALGLLIALGLFTRVAAFILSGTMAVAYFQFHFAFAFDGLKWLPIVNKGELAALYCFVFLLFAARGSGPYALKAD